MTRTFTSIEDLRSAIGQPIGPSAPLRVDQQRIDAFAEATGDRQWLHVDPARAAQGPYGTTVAHGYLTLSLISHFRQELLDFGFGTARINYGVEKVRFPAVLPAGSDVRATATVTAVSETPAGTAVTARYVLHADAEKPVCVAETIVLVTG
ncbi:MaoC family dehydratase [Nocardia thailandica]